MPAEQVLSVLDLESNVIQLGIHFLKPSVYTPEIKRLASLFERNRSNRDSSTRTDHSAPPFCGLNVGFSRAVPSTAAGTFDMTADDAVQPSIETRSTARGPVPAFRKTAAAARCEMPRFTSTSLMTNPERNSKMTGSKNAPVATTTACSASMGAPGPGDDLLQ